MDNEILIFIALLSGCIFIYYLYNRQIYVSQTKSPINGDKSKYTACLHDPTLNNGFILSIKSIDELKEIQGSLNTNDKEYEIKKTFSGYKIINHTNNLEQIIDICCPQKINKIMSKINTSPIDYSV